MIRTPLDGDWRLTLLEGPVPDGTPREVPASVPGTVHSDLLAAGVIPDPYLDLNEAEVQWIGRTDVRYDRSFEVDTFGHERVDLVAQGLDTIATLSLNGVELGRTKNQHRSYRFDLREVLTAGENHLGIDFASALTYAEDASERLGPRPFVGNAYPYNAIRKMACNFGWDWGPVLITAGIWKPIGIEAWSVARLATVRPVITVETVAHVAVHVDVERTAQQELEALVIVSDTDGSEVARVRQPFSADSTVVDLDIDAPQLWWPRGYGEQPLYYASVILLHDGDEIDRWQKPIGLRSVSVDHTPDTVGTGFAIRVNDEVVFIKGANWIPDDCFLPRITRADYARGVADAADAGMNLLRVWGGGIYENDDFYDLCDREGLLVWQDFLLACAAYSEDGELWDEVEAEARENIVRLSPHPSLVVWNGGNENVEGYWNWGWKEAMAEGETWGNGYYEGLLPAILAELDPTRGYVPSSPFNPAVPSEPRDPDNGTVHEWEVWNRQDYSTYRNAVPRFVAEFGFQGPPAFSTIERSIHDADLGPFSAGMLAHQKAEEGNAKLKTGLGAHLPEPSDFDDWHFATQLNQARAITYGIEHFRSWSPRTTGSIVWQLNDCWPVSSWAAVDGDKRRKPLWYALRAVNAQRLMTVQPRTDGLALIVSNDSPDGWVETIDVVRVDLEGTVLASQTVIADVAPRVTGTFLLDESIAMPGQPESELIVVSSASAARTFWYFVEDTVLAVPPLDVDLTVDRADDGYAVRIVANAFTKDLALNVDRLDPAAIVDDFLVTLLPGETATVRVLTSAELDPEALATHPIVNSVNGLLNPVAANRLSSS